MAPTKGPKPTPKPGVKIISKKIVKRAPSKAFKPASSNISQNTPKVSRAAFYDFWKSSCATSQGNFRDGKTSVKAPTAGRQPVTICSSSSNPILLKSPSSYASRNRSRVTLSREEIYAISLKADKDCLSEPTDHAATFAQSSLAQLTWGTPNATPVIAVEKPHRHSGEKKAGLGRLRGKQGAFDKFMYGERASKKKLPLVNEGIDESKCYFLNKVPLEIRWEIYENLLIHENAILVHHNWSFVHIKPALGNALLGVMNKQLQVEAADFLYRKNVFRALIKDEPRPTWMEEGGSIDVKYRPLFKNVIIECPKDKFGSKWLKKVAQSIKLLSNSDTTLNSLTLEVILPRRLGITRTLLGVETSPVTFADFFFTGPATLAPPSDIMIALTSLRCKLFNIVLRLPQKRRAIISVDMRWLPVNQATNELFSAEEQMDEAQMEGAADLSLELRGLKERVEAVVDDAEKAVQQGKAVWLEEVVRVGYGTKSRLAALAVWRNNLERRDDEG